MTKLISLNDLTLQAIEKETEALSLMDEVPTDSLMQAVRDNLDVWESSLFPLLKARKIPRYVYLTELLDKSGYKSVKPENLCVVVNKVRKERSARG